MKGQKIVEPEKVVEPILFYFLLITISLIVLGVFSLFYPKFLTFLLFPLTIGIAPIITVTASPKKCNPNETTAEKVITWIFFDILVAIAIYGFVGILYLTLKGLNNLFSILITL
jgi:hypothetical protein